MRPDAQLEQLHGYLRNVRRAIFQRGFAPSYFPCGADCWMALLNSARSEAQAQQAATKLLETICNATGFDPREIVRGAVPAIVQLQRMTARH